MTTLHKILFASALTALAGFASAQSSTMPADTAPAGTSSATTSPSATGSTDPYVKRREERTQARKEYKARKKAAKREYKAGKKEADTELKSSGAKPAAQGNIEAPSSPGK
ncbi:MAG TPA: hypothetical protein VJ698_13350 [Noviherbaspirillum sp.]|uniref:hypothetical protein n=1 Tax=Noviherbaspirillum sp. TaxID=1926288 RepID=UPI002B47F169|nr:hypothetical protein [Noviherbaspirillum sp.]HJV86453.1 hypothetical protein [Noviherbaspirillum sp.]